MGLSSNEFRVVISDIVNRPRDGVSLHPARIGLHQVFDVFDPVQAGLELDVAEQYR